MKIKKKIILVSKCTNKKMLFAKYAKYAKGKLRKIRE